MGLLGLFSGLFFWLSIIWQGNFELQSMFF